MIFFSDSFPQRRRFPPRTWVQTRPLLRPIGSIPLVDPTRCWRRPYGLQLWRRLHIGSECHASHRRTT